MKKGKLIALTVFGSLVLGGCGNSQNKTKDVVKLGVVGENNESWEYVQKELKENENIDLQLVKFTDYRQPITALEDGSVDLHSALTEIFMDNVNEESGFHNTTIAYTTLNPLGIYSDQIETLDELPDNATVALPNDVSNESRALLLLQTAELIKVDPAKGLLPEVRDVQENPKNLQFTLLESNQTARALSDVDISIINNNVAVDAGMIPTETAVFLEPIADSSKPYYNVIAARGDETDNDLYQTVVRYYQTDEVKKIIEDVTKKSSVPVW